MYVFDRSYLDYERFDCMTDNGYFFVSKAALLKSSLVIKSIRSITSLIGSEIILEEIIATVIPIKMTNVVIIAMKIKLTLRFYIKVSVVLWRNNSCLAVLRLLKLFRMLSDTSFSLSYSAITFA